MSIEFNRVQKTLLENKKELFSLKKDNKDLKKIIKILERKIDIIIDKIQDFEIVLDAAEILEERIQQDSQEYNTEWNPYEDEDFNIEDYEDNDDDGDIPHGY